MCVVGQQVNLLTPNAAPYSPSGLDGILLCEANRRCRALKEKPMQKPKPPAVATLVDTDASPKRAVRDRQRTLRVVVSDDERAEIERLAALAGLSVSAYLRTAGLNHQIRSVLDYAVARELIGAVADLGRFGGLMKLWLSEQRGKGASVVDVNKALHDARALQESIRALVHRVPTP